MLGSAKHRSSARWAAIGSAVAVMMLIAAPASATNGPGRRVTTRLLFSSDVNGTFDIWASRVDGSDPTVVTSGPTADIQPALAPDGNRFAYVVAPEISCCGPAMTVMVTTLDAKGPPTPITIPGVADTYRPAWSNDGRKLLLSGGAGGGQVANLYVVTVDTGTVDQLTTTGKDNYASWSPNSSRITFTSARDGKSRIWVMDANGSNPHPITSPDTGADTSPAWSPNGDRIAFRSTRDGSGEIYSAAPDGTALRRLTDDAFDDRFPTWSPDGRTIVYASVRAPRPITCPSPGLATCDSVLVAIDRAGGNSRLLTQPGTHADFPTVVRIRAAGIHG